MHQPGPQTYSRPNMTHGTATLTLKKAETPTLNTMTRNWPPLGTSWACTPRYTC